MEGRDGQDERIADRRAAAGQAHGLGIDPETCALDKGYDGKAVYDACEDRDIRPVICLKQTARVKRGDHKPPTCEHGEWSFAGADYDRKATKWRCPTGECKPASVWVKADRLHPAHPARDAALEGPLPGSRVRRALVRQVEERMGARAAPRARDRARPASRRPHDPVPVDVCAEAGAVGGGGVGFGG